VNRLHRGLLIVSTILSSWLGMQAVHEFGHVLGAWLTDGRVSQVILHPLAISRTDLAHNPSPLVVVWAGPIVGVTLPLMVWGMAALLHWTGAFLLRFFAGFCLIANGAYIGIGSFARIGDCAEMLADGSAMWQLWLFGAITVPIGLCLWNHQGHHFGIGISERRINPRAAYFMLLVCGLLLFLGFAVDGE
jgi:hypothetical protein